MFLYVYCRVYNHPGCLLKCAFNITFEHQLLTVITVKMYDYVNFVSPSTNMCIIYVHRTKFTSAYRFSDTKRKSMQSILKKWTNTLLSSLSLPYIVGWTKYTWKSSYLSRTNIPSKKSMNKLIDRKAGMGKTFNMCRPEPNSIYTSKKDYFQNRI